MDTWKALNEKRAEKGAEPIDISKVKNPADLPMNPQVIQAWQSLRQQQGMGGGESPFDMGDEDVEEDAGGGEEEEEQEPEGVGEDGWDEIDAPHGGAVVKKSLGGRGAIRIVI